MKNLLFLAFTFITVTLFGQLEKGPKIQFNKEVHDYGIIEYSADPYCTFEFKNTGNESLLITEARGSCGCTVPEWPKEPIAPGSTGSIKVTYDTKRVGSFQKSVTIMSNAINEPTKVINIKGEVLPQKEATNQLADGLYAEFNTSKGKIVCVLEYKKTPTTVANFVGLAEGLLNFNSPSKPFYDGLKFHRVIKDFMIQGGCPNGNGMGNPGYKFNDELVAELKHSGPGILSMANSGPNTNGSQFFITHKETPWLDGKHAVFGHVVEGQKIVDAIQQDDLMNSVKIIRVGSEASTWDAKQYFPDAAKEIIRKEEEKKRLEAERKKLEEEKKQNDYKITFFNEVKSKNKKAKASSTGLVYVISKKGKNPKKFHAVKGSQVSLHYTGTLFKDGTKFDSSLDRKEPFNLAFIDQKLIPGFEEGISLLGPGGKATLYIPYFLAYGDRDLGTIKPNSDLVFEIEILSIGDPIPANHDGHNHDGHDHSDPNHKH
jgi:cyclophilin family peptidyl-prolyl cis-trans isomerase